MKSRSTEVFKKHTSIKLFEVIREVFFTLIYLFLIYAIEIRGLSLVTQLSRLESKLIKSVKIFGNEPILRENLYQLNALSINISH